MIKDGIEMRFVAAGASAADVLRAEQAGWAVFEVASVNPWAAAAASFKQEGEQEDLTDEEFDHAALWWEAHAAAMDAYTSHGTGLPPDADLILVRSGDQR
jgi:hypothetical protein